MTGGQFFLLSLLMVILVSVALLLTITKLEEFKKPPAIRTKKSKPKRK